MKKIFLSGINKDKFALVDDEDFDQLSKFKWHYSLGYAYRSKKIKRKVKNNRMHRDILNAKLGQIIDHKNGDKLDNRKENIRFATNSQNMWNTKKIRAKSGYKGVRQNPRGYTWTVGICKDNIRMYIGNFKTKLEAAAAYNSAAHQLFGEFASVNSL